MNELEEWNRDAIRRRRAWLGVCVAACSNALFVVDASLVSLSLPKVEAEFGDVARSTIGWMASGFMVAQTSLLLIGGRVGDRRGRKKFFLFGLMLFSLAALLTAAAPNIQLVIAGRVAQGAGAAFLTSSGLALVLPMFPHSKAPIVIGTWGAIGSAAAWLTPSLGALVVEHSWRLAFVLVAPVGMTIFLIGRKVLVEQGADYLSGRTDRASYLLGPIGLGTMMFVLSQAPHLGWTSLPVVTLGPVAAVLIALFIQRCATTATPLLDLSIARTPIFAANALAGCIQQVGFFGWFLTGPLIMTGLWGWSVREAGLAVALSQVMSTIGAPIGGRMVTRFGYTPPIVVSSMITASGSFWLFLTATEQPDFWFSYLPAALVMGFGAAICGTMTVGAALGAIPAQSMGAGNSLLQLVRRMGGAIGVAVAIALLGNGTGDALLPGARRVWLMVTVVHIAMGVPLLLTRSAVRDQVAVGRAA